MAPSWKSTASKKTGSTSSEEALPKGEDKDRSLDAAKQSAYRMLSYRDRTSHELDVKLKEKGFSEEVISEVISFLQKTGVLDDGRFARQWARSRTEYRHIGPIRLRRELLEKGISTGEADAVLHQLSEEHDPVAAAEGALTRRFKGPGLFHDVKIRQRAFVFLQRKGFAAETILKAFKKMGAGDPCPGAAPNT
jgi:regulatory protein